MADPPTIGDYMLSEQGTALAADVQSAFCAGAWVAVIVVAACVVEAQLRECEASGVDGGMKSLIDAVGGDSELHWLRLRRNELCHVDPDSPAITVDEQWASREKLENEARRATQAMFAALYMSPGL